jgi:glycosyltransferase involved in cell wall biosynthesis
MNNDNRRCRSALLIGNPHSNESVRAFLIKYTKILSQLFDTIIIIAGDATAVNSNKIIPIPVKYTISSNPIKQVFNFIKIQILLVNFIIKFHTYYEYVILFPQLFVLPVVFAKIIFKKNIIVYAGGRASSSIKYMLNKHWRQRDYLLYLILNILENIVFTLAYTIIVESKSAVSYLDLIKYNKKIVICPQWVDFTAFKIKHMINERPNNVGYVGRFSPEKGFVEFLKSIIIIEKMYKNYHLPKDITFILIGGDSDKIDFLNRFLSKLSNVKVIILGWLSHENIPEVLNSLKLLVIPSYSEGLPNTLLEAMACGTPVLATSVGAIPDIIKDNENGFLLRSNDPRHIAEKIVEILNKPEILDKISINAYEYIRKKFSYEKTLQIWKELLVYRQSRCHT